LVSRISKCSFENFNQLKSTYGNASIVSNDRVIFNIKGNDFRLIVSINFKRQAAYIIWIGTHKEYDTIDAATIKYTL
jgi:mRNA interferase HigB